MIGKEIIITESSITANAIIAISGRDALATYGHVFDYDYINSKLVLVAKNPSLLERLQHLNSPEQRVIIATDNDAQGELIAQHIKALTPTAKHDRVHINDLSKEGIEFAINRPLEINNALANEGAYLRLLNLKLSKIEPRGTLTTTSITLADSFISRGRLNELDNFTLRVAGEEFHVRFPEKLGGSIEHTLLPEPAITRNITQLCAVQNIINTHNSMQSLYESRKLSYIRTDSRILPNVNAVYQHHTSNEVLSEAHYAIHNLSPYHSDIERYVFKINNSAKSTDTSVVELRTSIGSMLAINERLTTEPLKPTAELMLHLSLDENSYASTIGRASHTYERMFYKNGSFKPRTVNSIYYEGSKHVPEIVNHGLKHVIKHTNPISELHVLEQEDVVHRTNFDRSPSISFSPNSDLSHFM
ncbi:toprim domain-containing protein [Vibrio coralliilyticus]|uniref:toprim domain-containing protein n=1 Tax=Vibrio coralliilyticus TaxID=190893 RepID=UPI001E630117|nr:toprim domain-containing protein [Vibrio coralliilyticus]